MTARDYVMVSGRLRQRSWETRRGEKRSVTEIEADEVGASLKLATAKVERARCAAPATAAKPRSGRPNAAATSTTPRRFDQLFDVAPAPGFGRGHDLWQPSSHLAGTPPSTLPLRGCHCACA
jgi:single-stranded DNA-binding protein